MGGNKKRSKLHTKLTTIALLTSLLVVDVTTLIGNTTKTGALTREGITTIQEESPLEESEGSMVSDLPDNGVIEDLHEERESMSDTEDESSSVIEDVTDAKDLDEDIKTEEQLEATEEPEQEESEKSAIESTNIDKPKMSRMLVTDTTNQYVLATDTDFSGATNGTFRYKGDAEYVEIPHVIKGVNVTSYERMFEGIPVKGVKSTNKNITNMGNMFRRSDSGVLDVSQLDTTNVTNMTYMFAGVDGGQNKITEIKGLDNFNTSRVYNMSSMFSTSDVRNIDLRSFDTSNVTDMSGMFYVSMATSIQGLEGFDTTKVSSMSSMFASSRAIELDLRGFNTSKVTTMSTMFMNSYALNINGVGDFDTSKVVSMSRMFEQTRDKHIDVSSFNTENVETMNSMFRLAETEEINVSNFDTSNVLDMYDMFADSEATKIELGSINTGKVRSMSGMFRETEALALDLTSFDTKNVTTMKDMFYNAKAKSILLGEGFKTGNVTNMSYMFSKSEAETLDVSNFDTYKVTLMDSMFSGSKARTIKGLESFNTVNVVDMGNMFNGSNAEDLDLRNFNTSKVENMVNIFKGTKANTLDLSSFDTSRITDMSSMFEGSDATTIDVTRVDTSNVYSMKYMFKDTRVDELDLSGFDMSSVNGLDNMFSGTTATKGLAKSQTDAEILNSSSGLPKTLMFKPKYVVATDEDFSGTLNGYFRYIGDDDFVEIPHTIKGVNVNNYTSMFSGTSVRGVVSTNKKVTNMSYMFDGNTSASLDVSGINTVNVSHMEGMFKDTRASKLDFSTFNTGKVVNTSRMFENSIVTELDLGSFDLTNAYKLDNMFRGAKITKGYARSEEDATKLNYSSNKNPTLNFTVWSVTTKQDTTDWTNESVTINVSSNNDQYDIDYVEMLNGEGRNLLTGSDFDSGTGELEASSGHATVSDSVYTLKPTGFNVNYTYTNFRKNLVPNETYTLSLKHRNNVPLDFRGGVNVSGYNGKIQPTDEWKVSHITFKTTKTDVILRLYFGMGYGLSTSKMEIDWMKLEKGAEPTPWSLAPEDDEVIDNKKDYQVSVNGTYVFKVTDTGGNAKTVSHTVSNIDTVNPTAILKSSPEGWTSQDVTIYVDAKDDLSGVSHIVLPDGKTVNGSKSEYKVPENGKYTFKVVDKAGNTSTYTEEVTNIDRSIPKLNADIDNKEWTRNPINIKVSSEESASGLADIKMVSSPEEGRNLVLKSGIDIRLTKDSNFVNVQNYLNVASGIDLDKTFLGKNTILSYDVHTLGGREANPRSNFTDDISRRFGIHGAVTWKDSTGEKANTVHYPYATHLGGVFDNKRISQNYLVERSGYDSVRSFALAVQPFARPSKDNNETWVLKDAKLEVGEYATPWTPAPEDIQLIGNSKTYPVVANGLYTFEAKYNNNATSEVSVNVTNIDLEKPTITIQDNPEDWVEDDEATLIINAKDTLSGVSKIVLPDGKEVNGSTATFKVTKNGDYTFKAVDKVGNEITHTETVEYLMIPYNFYIYDTKGNPATGVEFELLRDGEAYKRTTSNTEGLVDFGFIPPSGKYSIRQVSSGGGFELDPEKVETPDVNEPVEFITYPRGDIFPSTGTNETILLAGLALTIGGILASVRKKKRKLESKD